MLSRFSWLHKHKKARTILLHTVHAMSHTVMLTLTNPHHWTQANPGQPAPLSLQASKLLGPAPHTSASATPASPGAAVLLNQQQEKDKTGQIPHQAPYQLCTTAGASLDAFAAARLAGELEER